MKKCPKCGATYADNDTNYCKLCGAPLVDMDEKSEFKEKMDDAKEDIKEKFEDIKEDIEEKIEDLKEKIEEKKEDFEEKHGDKMDDFEDKAKEAAAAAKEAAQKAGAAAREGFEKAMDTEDTTAQYDPDDIEKNKILALFAYLGILILVPVFGAKDSRFARFHINQGLILLLCEVACSVLSAIPVLGFVFIIVNVMLFVLAIMGIINTATGKAKELPLIGKFKLVK